MIPLDDYVEDYPTRRARREFDVDLQLELLRGELAGMRLPSRWWNCLDRIVAEAPIEEETLARRSRFHIMGRLRTFRTVDGLVALGYVGRVNGILIPTVAGFGAVRPLTSLGVSQTHMCWMRALRHSELRQGLANTTNGPSISASSITPASHMISRSAGPNAKKRPADEVLCSCD